MWKCVSRNFKSVIFKNQCSRNNVATRDARNTNVNSLLKFSPVIFSRFNRAYGQEKRSSCGQSRNNDREKENPKTGKHCNLEDFENSCFRVLQWSSIFAVAWHLLQPFSHRKTVSKSKPTGNCTFSIFSKYIQNEYFRLVHYFDNGLHPFHYILPEVKTNTSKSKCKTDSSDEINESKLDDLLKAHHIVVGSLSNCRGARSMENGNYTDAFYYFQQGAEVNNPSAIFNAGLCHEMGYGTNQDFKKAAEMYKKASDLGHATAMYNLGVFYVNGWGELPLDLNEARKLFETAANLGQMDALQALELDNKNEVSSIVPRDDIREASELSNEKKSTNNINSSNVKSDKLYYFPISLKDDLLKKGTESEDDSGTFDMSPQGHFGTVLI